MRVCSHRYTLIITHGNGRSTIDRGCSHWNLYLYCQLWFPAGKKGLIIPNFSSAACGAPTRPAQLWWTPSKDPQPTWRWRLEHLDWHNSWRVMPRCGKVRFSELEWHHNYETWHLSPSFFSSFLDELSLQDIASWNVHIKMLENLQHIPSGKHTRSYWKWPSRNSEFSH